MSNAKLSIITCSYNQGQYLEQTILSVLNQNYQNLEYIIIDGGSTDNSVEIIKKYDNKLAYWISQKDEGQSDAINKGFLKATGDIIAWINSDDLYLAHTFETIVKYFNVNKDIDCVYGDIYLSNSTATSLLLRKTIPYDYKMAIYSECMIPQPTSFWRRRVFDKIGLLDLSLQYQMDYEYFLRMGKMNVRFNNIKIPLAIFRFHAECKTVSEYDSKVAQANKIIKNKYINCPFKSDVFNEYYLRIMRTTFRLKAYIIRVVLRGEGIIPFRVARFRKKLLKGNIL